MNEISKLLPQQEGIINSTFDDWQGMYIPAEGWTFEEINIELDRIEDENNRKSVNVVFVFNHIQIPVMLKKVTKQSTKLFSAVKNVFVLSKEVTTFDDKKVAVWKII